MLKEQDIRAKDRNPHWAKFMAPDGVFGFQFNIDFHPTRRKFLDRSEGISPSKGSSKGETPLLQPWVYEHTKHRNWSTDTDRAMFPLRALVPVERDGLLGASKNIGVTSLVQSALRLHGQMMLCGQASGTVAALCLRDHIEPRVLAGDPMRVREIQMRLVRGGEGKPGVLLWPYHDLKPDDAHFEAANMLSVLGIWKAEADSLDFEAGAKVTPEEFAEVMTRVQKMIGVTNLEFHPSDAMSRASLVQFLWAGMKLSQ